MGKTKRDRARGREGSQNRHHRGGPDFFDDRHSYPSAEAHRSPHAAQEWRPGQSRPAFSHSSGPRREFIPNEFSAKIRLRTLEGTFDPAHDKQVFVDLMPPTEDKGRALKIKDKTGDRSAFVLIPDQGTAIVEFFGVVMRLMEHMGITAEQARASVASIPISMPVARPA